MSYQRILLLYPNERDMSLVPPVFALFASILRREGHIVGFFDSTGYDFDGKFDSGLFNERTLEYKPVIGPSSNLGVKPKTSNMFDDLVAEVEEFSPDIIMMSVTESTFIRGVSLVHHLRFTAGINIPTAVGGVFPTFSPERTIKEPSIDIICLGEGELAIVELASNLGNNKDISKIPNLWVKNSKGSVTRNPPGPAVDIDTMPPLDFTIFEDDRFYRPMSGKMYRMLPVETHRGCPYTCTFCNSPTQNALYKSQTKSLFFRKKSMIKIREELINFRDRWNGEYVFFWADTFLAWNKHELEEFCEMYSEFKFPFWCQSRTETISDSVGGYDKLKMLKDVGLHHMSFGIEHGNEDFRARMIDRKYSNEDAIAALKNPRKLDIPITANNIIGFPDETRELAMDTIELNRQIDSFNLTCSTFAPFKGTKLRDIAEERGYIDKETISPPNADWSILNMPRFTKEEIYGLQRTFVMYTKFPKNRWPDLRKAETLNEEGDKVWTRMREEFVETYFKDIEFDISKVNE